MSHYIRLLRCQQWLKNLFIFAPAFFANKLFSPNALSSTAVAFIAFGLVSSSMYIFNDIIDMDEDRRHPTKRFRPVASGEIGILPAKITSVICAVSGYILAGFLNFQCLVVLGIYSAVNIAYTLRLKHFAILDIMIISFGFLLRLSMGAQAINIGLSQWIVVMTFLLAMFLALAKRRDDCVIKELSYNGETAEVRKSINGYSFLFIDISLAIMASVMLIAYLIYCMSPEVIERLGKNVYLTFIFVVAGILRYLQITLVFRNSGSPTLILIKDRLMQLIVFAWLAAFSIVIYIH